MSLLEQFEEQSLLTNTTSSSGYITTDKPYQSSRNVMSSATSQVTHCVVYKLKVWGSCVFVFLLYTYL